jgi:type IV secretion system protein VirD4
VIGKERLWTLVNPVKFPLTKLYILALMAAFAWLAPRLWAEAQGSQIFAVALLIALVFASLTVALLFVKDISFASREASQAAVKGISAWLGRWHWSGIWGEVRTKLRREKWVADSGKWLGVALGLMGGMVLSLHAFCGPHFLGWTCVFEVSPGAVAIGATAGAVVGESLKRWRRSRINDGIRTAIETMSRGKTLVAGLWFCGVGSFLLWISVLCFLTALSDKSAAQSVWFWPGLGAAFGLYCFFWRGLGAIVSAWSGLSTDTHGKARWAPLRMLQRAGLVPRKGGIYLGRFLDDGVPGDRVSYPGPVHLLTIGPTGSGKGTGLIIPNLSELRRSIIIIDPKGEAAAITARKRAQFGRVVVLNPFNILADEQPWLKSNGYNPLATLDKTSAHLTDDATAIAEALVRVEGSEPHWAASAQDLVAALVMHEVMTNKTPTLGNVREMLTQPYLSKDGLASGLAETIVDMELSGYGPLKAKIGKFRQPTNETRSIVSAATTQTRFLDSPPIIEDLARNDGFNFADMKNEIVTVYLILPATHLETHSNWLRLMIASALRALLATPASRKLPPVLFMLDEFAQLGHLPLISNAMNMSRSFGVQIWPIVQDLNQLHYIYKDNWENFIGACAALTSFAPRDLFTANYLSGRFGDKTVIVENENIPPGLRLPFYLPGGGGRGPQGMPLVRPQELMEMPAGQMLCLAAPVKNPFFTTAPGYWKTSFAHGLDDNPYHRG